MPGTTQADFDLQHRESVEGLGDCHSEAHTLFDPHGQGLLGIWRNHRRNDGHTARSDGNADRTFL
jgi:hypothetical protein